MCTNITVSPAQLQSLVHVRPPANTFIKNLIPFLRYDIVMNVSLSVVAYRLNAILRGADPQKRDNFSSFEAMFETGFTSC